MDRILETLKESWNAILAAEEAPISSDAGNEFITPPADVKQTPLEQNDGSNIQEVEGDSPNPEVSQEAGKPQLMGKFKDCPICAFEEHKWDDTDAPEERIDGDDMNDSLADQGEVNVAEANKTTIPKPSTDTPDFDMTQTPSKFNRGMYKQELQYAASDPEHNKPGAKPLNTQPDTANPGQEEPVFVPNKQDPSTYGDRAGDRTVPAKTMKKAGINIKDDPDAYLDQLKVLMLATPPDDKLFGANAKLQKSGDDASIFFDFTLPAYSGIYYNEKLNDFQMLTTCPSAGECKKFCYARKGNFTQYPANHLPRSQMLSYLINHPKEFVERMINKISAASKNQQKKGKKVHFRWHDSGDWFSPTYARMALYIASKTPNVLHYAYTKQVKMIKEMMGAGEVPANFIFNFSFAGQQDNLIDRATDKFSFVIKPDEDLIFNLGTFKKTWKQLMNAQGAEKKAKSALKKAKTGSDQAAISTAQQNLEFARQVVDEALHKVDRDCMNDTLKGGIEKKLGLPAGSVITYFEMVAKPENPEQNPKWSVLVYPGCGDISAARKDVSGTLLLIH